MNRRRDNIVAMAWADVLCPLARAADPLSWIMFIAFLVAIVVSIVARAMGDGGLHNAYEHRYPLFWYGSWLIFVISTVGPIFNLTKERKEVPLGVLIGVSVVHVVTFICISVVMLTLRGEVTAITALLAATAAAAMVGIGWVVQHQSGARSSRRAHTFNILMQSRLSSEFQNQIKKRADLYSAGNPVAAEDAKLVNKAAFDEALKALDIQRAAELSRAKEESKESINAIYAEKTTLLTRKYESLQGLKYLLNFYEFICAGIVLRELDEALIRETLKDMAVALYEDSMHVRLAQRKNQPAVFLNLDRVIGPIWPITK
jgi:hypothetical protein